VCDLETSRMGAPYIYIYIYDISRLRVKYHSTRFGWSFRPSSGFQACTHNIRCMSYRLVDFLLAGARWNSIPSRAR